MPETEQQPAAGATNQQAESIQGVEEPFVEQHYPREMSWYAAEGPEGMVEDVALWIREHPWAAVGIAAAAGLAMTIAAKPLGRLAAQSLEAFCGDAESPSSTPPVPPDAAQTP